MYAHHGGLNLVSPGKQHARILRSLLSSHPPSRRLMITMTHPVAKVLYEHPPCRKEAERRLHTGDQTATEIMS